MRAKLTKKMIDSLAEAEDSRGERYYDKDIPGFGLVAYPTGRKSFFLEYSLRGSQRRMTLGLYGALTVEDARRKAQSLLGKVIDGEDPLESRSEDRRKFTFGEWADDYLERMRPRKKHIRDDIRYLSEAKERWGRRPLDGINTDDIETLFHDKEKSVSKVTANRLLASVRACLQDAWRKDKIPQNPAMKVRPLPENPPRKRVLHDDELARVLKAIDALKSEHSRAGIMLLVQTGARLSEVLHAQWKDMDLEGRIWNIPSPKAGTPQVVPLSNETVAMLNHLSHMGCYVIAGRVENKPRTDLKKAWETVLKKSGVEDVHIHDLRRTFGLHITRKAGLHIASKLLRHSDIRVTEKHYAPLGFDELRSALEQRGADVVSIRKRQKKRSREEAK